MMRTLTHERGTILDRPAIAIYFEDNNLMAWYSKLQVKMAEPITAKIVVLFTNRVAPNPLMRANIHKKQRMIVA